MGHSVVFFSYMYELYRLTIPIDLKIRWPLFMGLFSNAYISFQMHISDQNPRILCIRISLLPMLTVPTDPLWVSFDVFVGLF